MGIIRRCKRNSGLRCKKAKKEIKGYNPNRSKYAELLELQQAANVRTNMMPNQATTMQPTTLNKKTLTDQEARLLITNYFIQALKSPPSHEWNGNDGTIVTIQNQLHLPQGSNTVIRNVLENLATSDETCTKYMGEQKPGWQGKRSSKSKAATISKGRNNQSQ